MESKFHFKFLILNEFMFFRKNNHDSIEWKRFVVWMIATVTMPLIAIPIIRDVTLDIQFSVQVILILAFFWGVCSSFLRIFINQNVK